MQQRRSENLEIRTWQSQDAAGLGHGRRSHAGPSQPRVALDRGNQHGHAGHSHGDAALGWGRRSHAGPSQGAPPLPWGKPGAAWRAGRALRSGSGAAVAGGGAAARGPTMEALVLGFPSCRDRRIGGIEKMMRPHAHANTEGQKGHFTLPNT